MRFGLAGRIAAIGAASQWSHVLDGRFKGGWITRTHGRPRDGVHAVQMELAMRAYLRDEGEEPAWDADFATPIQQTLRTMLETCLLLWAFVTRTPRWPGGNRMIYSPLRPNTWWSWSTRTNYQTIMGGGYVRPAHLVDHQAGSRCTLI